MSNEKKGERARVVDIDMFPLDIENAEVVGAMITRTAYCDGEKCVGFFMSPARVGDVESDFVIIDKVLYLDFATALAFAEHLKRLAYETQGGFN